MLKNIKIAFYVFLFTLSFFIYAASSQSYQYDTNGNLTQTINANDFSIAYEYDDFNRLIAKDYQNGKKIQYEYDSIGHRVAIKEGNKVISYEYDIFGNISKITFPNSQSVQYLYDPLGNLLKLTYPDNSSVIYSYDNSNRLISITDFSGTTQYEYNEKLNALKKKILPNGTSTEFIYNSDRRISNVIHKNKEQKLIKEYQYEYDLNGNRIKIEEIDLNTRANIVYIYDKLNRLVNAKYSNGFFESYTYDQIGNRLSKTTPQGTINYEYDLENRLIKANDTKYCYDNAGNLIIPSQRIILFWDMVGILCLME